MVFSKLYYVVHNLYAYFLFCRFVYVGVHVFLGMSGDLWHQFKYTYKEI